MKKTIRFQNPEGNVIDELEIDVPKVISGEELKKIVSIMLKAHVEMLRTLRGEKSN